MAEITANRHASTSHGTGHGWSSVVDRQALRFLWRYARPYRLRLLAAVATALPMAALSGVLPWAGKQITQSFAESAPLRGVMFWIGIALAGIVARSGLEIVNRVVLTVLHVRMTNDVRNDLYKRIQDGSLAFHKHSRTGEVASLISNDTQAIGAGVIDIYSALWQYPATLIFLLCLMFYLNPLLSLIAISSIPLLSLCTLTISRLAKKAERRYLEHQGQLLGVMIESLTNVRQIKSFGLEDSSQQKFGAEGEQLIKYRRRATILKSLISPAAEISNGVAIAFMALIAYYQVQRGATDPGTIAGCLVAAIGTVRPLKAMSRSLVNLQRTFAGIHRIRWAYNDPAEDKRTTAVEGPVQAISLEDVSFAYDARQNILSNISFEACRGERIAILGPSGTGKTTLLDIITGFYPCSSGMIRIDGTDLAEIDLVSWRRQIGIVSQEPFLFDDTIKENVLLGYRQADDRRILEALERAGCAEMLSRLPDGIHTQVGERGCLLSGGERKRVALARALVRPISLLVLDEAFSELDPKTEESILDAIDNLASDLIVLHATHRKAVLGHCDRALVLLDGTAKQMPLDQAMLWAECDRE